MSRKRNKQPGVKGSRTTKNPEPEPQIMEQMVNSNSQSKYLNLSRSKNKKEDTICHCPTCNDSRYEFFNKVSENGDCIYIPPFEELKGGKIYVSLDAISDIEKEELWKRLGPSLKKDFEEN